MVRKHTQPERFIPDAYAFGCKNLTRELALVSSQYVQMTVHLHEPTTGSLPNRAIASGPSFSILNWCAWAPDRETRAAWCGWAEADRDAHDAVPPQALPMMMRRRLSPFGQRLMNVIATCAQGLPSARYVLSTRHGELSRALNILKDIEVETLPSPTDFSMAIHHALLGLMSIHSDNRLGHTALSAGWESFGAGLLEAAVCIAERPEEPVILIHADEPLPASYAAFREADDTALPLIVALAIGLGSARRWERDAAGTLTAK